jgi:hypothetical protein
MLLADEIAVVVYGNGYFVRPAWDAETAAVPA